MLFRPYRVSVLQINWRKFHSDRISISITTSGEVLQYMFQIDRISMRHRNNISSEEYKACVMYDVRQQLYFDGARCCRAG
jgi:hypothetical protein